jgi:hypothetical protein
MKLSPGRTRTTDPSACALPLWRLIGGILVLVAMGAVLSALAPVYFEDYRLRQYIRSQMRSPDIAAATDDALRKGVLARARQLNLPVASSDIQIARAGGKIQLQLKYAVQMDFPLYQVDLHFHPGAASR